MALSLLKNTFLLSLHSVGLKTAHQSDWRRNFRLSEIKKPSHCNFSLTNKGFFLFFCSFFFYKVFTFWLLRRLCFKSLYWDYCIFLISKNCIMIPFCLHILCTYLGQYPLGWFKIILYFMLFCCLISVIQLFFFCSWYKVNGEDSNFSLLVYKCVISYN